jgi:AcrR family transcriptional regulator
MARTPDQHDEEQTPAPRLRADARRNRAQILAAARELFADHGSGAPLEEVAQRAGVGIGTLYRHFPDRQALMRAVAVDVLAQVAHEARLALAAELDAFQALARYMHRALDLHIGAVMPALVSQIPREDAELHQARAELTALVQQMIDRAQAEGALRPEIVFGDIGMLIIRLSRPLPQPISRELDARLAHRHLDLLLDGLRAAGDSAAARLPEPALSLADLQTLSGDPAL